MIETHTGDLKFQRMFNKLHMIDVWAACVTTEFRVSFSEQNICVIVHGVYLNLFVYY